jgi:hypothetical protein
MDIAQCKKKSDFAGRKTKRIIQIQILILADTSTREAWFALQKVAWYVAWCLCTRCNGPFPVTWEPWILRSPSVGKMYRTLILSPSGLRTYRIQSEPNQLYLDSSLSSSNLCVHNGTCASHSDFQPIKF